MKDHIVKILFQEKSELRTDSEPIYDHFPGLPETERVEWRSVTHGGIGPSTVELYIFAFLTDDTAMDARIAQHSLSEDEVKIDSIFTPKDLDNGITWRQLLDVPFCFQENSPYKDLMHTKIYISNDRKIVFIYAIGE